MDRIVECVPNFSEGRKAETVEALVTAIRSISGSVLLDQQSDADHYQSVANVPTTVGARTGLWYEKRDRFYLAVPANSKQGAALWVYAPED